MPLGGSLRQRLLGARRSAERRFNFPSRIPNKMNFLSISYCFFLLSTLGIYWSVNQINYKVWVLLVASIVFYSSLQYQYIPLLLALIFINYRIGIALGENTSPGKHNENWQISNEQWQYAQADWNHRRLKLLWLGIGLNILLLFGFKYLPPIFGISSSNNGLKIIAPLGLSFFTFECISYLVDVYRGAPATDKFVDFASYKLFFAKFISGPITRYHSWENQLKNLSFPFVENIVEALWIISCGAIKKGVLADNLGIYVDICFKNLQRAGSTDIWLATIAYGLQLYLDFSGYVDIARGTALLFGIRLPENFDYPYLSTNIADFWRRWHMTLGDWLRNYLYFPLGGSRRGLKRTYINLMIVMVVCGIWHGAALGFVFWGALHGLALVVHRFTDSISNKHESLELFWQNPIGIFSAWLLTQSMVFISWITFRLPNLTESGTALLHLFGHGGDAQFTDKVYIEALNTSPSQIGFILTSIFSFMTISYIFNQKLKLQLSWILKLVFVPLCIYAVWILAPQNNLPYIYFDF